MLGETFQPSPPSYRLVLQMRRAAAEGPLQRHPRLPVRVAIMLLYKNIHGRKGVMVHLATKMAGLALHDHMLVHLVIPALGVALPSVFRNDLSDAETGANSSWDSRRVAAIFP